MDLDIFRVRSLIKGFCFGEIELKLEIEELESEIILDQVTGEDIEYNRKKIAIKKRQLEFIERELKKLGEDL